MTKRPPGTEILLLYRVVVAGGALTPAAIAKLAPYMTRYAETLNVRIHAVGGVNDHLHILADIPADMTADRVPKELLAPAARYLRDVLAMKGFGWGTDAVTVLSVSPSLTTDAVAYLAEQPERHAGGELIAEWEVQPDDDAGDTSIETLPAWLTGAMERDT